MTAQRASDHNDGRLDGGHTHGHGDWRKVPYAEALRILGDIAERLAQDPWGVRREGGVGPEACDAVLAFFKGALRDPGPPTQPEEVAWRIAPVLITSLTDSQIEELLDEVVFGAEHPVVYATLAPWLKWRVPAADIEAAVVRQLRSGDPSAQRNARELAYFVFDGDPAYPLGDQGRLALEEVR